MMTCDTSNLTFDISGTAALYSQLSGVLAAFAFGAIALVLPGSHRRGQPDDSPDSGVDDRRDEHVLLALVAAFLSLIVATVEYAVLAGERGCALLAGRAASEEFLGGMALAFAVLLLLTATVQLVVYSGIQRIGHHARLLVCTIGPPLSILFLSVAAQDVAMTPWIRQSDSTFRPQDTEFVHATTAVALTLPTVMFVICVLGWFVNRYHPDWPLITWVGALRLSWFPYISMLLVVVAVVRSTTLAVTDPYSHVEQWEVWTWLVVCSV